VNDVAKAGAVKTTSVDERAVRILRENAGSLERLLASYARSEADRADLRQDVALALWSALPGFRGDCSERTFLLRVAHNRALTFIAKRGAPTEEIEDHADRVVATSGKNPAIAYERKERESRLLAAVRALPVLHRQVMTLMLEGLSHREIAAVLGTTENNVGVRANRARAAVRVLLEDQDNPEVKEVRDE
jgi:RNA polymerase sigma-70 factor (ECF subfamily)